MPAASLRSHRDEEGHPRSRSIEPDEDGCRHGAQPGRRPAPHQQAARRHQGPRHHGRRDVRQLRHEGRRRQRGDDVASGDLPGPGNPNGNSMPITVLQDTPERTDEGRAMLQIVHDVAPKARLGFATANGGEVNFANNIRALAGNSECAQCAAGLQGGHHRRRRDLPSEPIFQDGIVAQAVDEVAAAGVSHFSSAGNRSASESYDSAVRIVPGPPASWSNTNLDFSGRRPGALRGRLPRFRCGIGAVDIAQTIEFADPGGSLIVFQWNEPYDPKPPTVVQVIAEGTGTVPEVATPRTSRSTGRRGRLVEIFVDGDATAPGNANPGRRLRPVRSRRQLSDPVRTTRRRTRSR